MRKEIQEYYETLEIVKQESTEWQRLNQRLDELLHRLNHQGKADERLSKPTFKP